MAITRSRRRGRGRRGVSVTGALALALGGAMLGPAPGLAQAWRCVPGSIGPGGCASIRPQDRAPERPAFVPPPLSDRLLDEMVIAPGQDGAPRIIPLAPGVSTRQRPPPDLPDPARPSDPRALQRDQTPYVLDGRGARGLD